MKMMKRIIGFLSFLFMSVPCVVLASTEGELEVRNVLQSKYNYFFINENVANQCLGVDGFESIYRRAMDTARQIKERCLQENKDYCDTQYLSNIQLYGIRFIEEQVQHITRIDCPNSGSIQALGNGDRIANNLQRFPNLVYVNLENSDIHSDISSLPASIRTLLLTGNHISYVDITNAFQLEQVAVDENVIFKMLNGSFSLGKRVENRWTEVSYGNLFHSYWDEEKYILDQFNNQFVPLKTTSKSIKNLLSSFVPDHVTVSYKNKQGNVLGDDDYIGTGTTLLLKTAIIQEEYTIFILGDVTGTGDVSIADVAKTYQHYKKRKLMEPLYAKAANVAGNDDTVDIADVAKLYQYAKNKISSLD